MANIYFFLRLLSIFLDYPREITGKLNDCHYSGSDGKFHLSDIKLIPKTYPNGTNYDWNLSMIKTRSILRITSLAIFCLTVNSACSQNVKSVRGSRVSSNSNLDDNQENTTSGEKQNLGALVGSCNISTDFGGTVTEICIESLGSDETMPKIQCEGSQGQFTSEENCPVEDIPRAVNQKMVIT